MEWAKKIAAEIVARKPDKEEYVCAAGISPSGSVHIGNFRDIATSYFVVLALRKMGKRARLLFSWDEFDRLRKIPANVSGVWDNENAFIGRSYVDVPNPFPEKNNAASYAEYFEREFMDAVSAFGIDLDYRYQAEQYRSGAYADKVILALQKRKAIFDVLDRHRSQTATEEERENFYPVSIYCEQCGRDTTHILSLSEDCTQARYRCKCGHEADFDFRKDFNCKLSWKVDWPMRWMHEGVDFEPGGKDHATAHGSYDASKDISREIFGYEPPIFQGYEFIGIRGMTGKMSGSSGLNLTPAVLLRLYQPEVILWLYAKCEPMKSFDFCFDDGILRQYFEFDKMLTQCREGTADERIQDIISACTIPGRTVQPVSMTLLVQMGSIVNFNAELLEIILAKIGMPYQYDQFADRLNRAQYWLETCAPDQVYQIRKYRNWEMYNALEDLQKQEVALLYRKLSEGEYSLDDTMRLLYAIPDMARHTDLEPKEKKKAQSVFFRNLYQLLLGRDTGPRLYLFLHAFDKQDYLYLLDFSAPETDEEIRARTPAEPVETNTEKPVTRVRGEADPVSAFRPEISLEEFNRIDLRVCRILKCQEIRKARNNYKITVFDGVANRVIVSSLKDEYTPEQLIGRKIIVVANLAPARLTGVQSAGMLLAATNTACGCQVIFVDDSVPEGTCIR